MIIPKSATRCWTILLPITILLFVYFTLLNLSLNQTFQKTKSYKNEVKTIVAYSLLKQIELEGENYVCDGQFNSTLNAINGSVKANNGNKVTRWNDQDGWTKIDGSDFYVSSVNLDRRLDPYHYVRIIGMIKGTSNQPLYCQILATDGIYQAVRATVTPIWSDHWDHESTNSYFNPVLLSCVVPFGKVPTSVSIATVPCRRPIGSLEFAIIESRNRSQNTFTICVKPLDFLDDISKRLIQWIEISWMLGAGKIDIYVKRVRKNIWKILKWYSSTFPDKVTVRKFRNIMESNSPPHQNQSRLSKFSQKIWQKRRYEVIAYNNCFYQNINTSQFIIPLDIDEIIIPRKFLTWDKLLNDLFTSSPDLKENFASFTVPNAYYFGKTGRKKAEAIFFLGNSKRSRLSPAGESGKSFISVRNSLTVFNHYALDVLKPGISRSYFIPPDLVQLNHYKNGCNAVILPECEKYLSSPGVDDPVVFRYKNSFFKRYKGRLSELKRLAIM